MTRTKLTIPLALVGVLALPTAAAAQTYTFNVHKKLVNISFESKMEVEDILGTSHEIKGYVKRDSQGKISFDLKVPVKSLKTGIAMRDGHLQAKQWLHASAHPDIRFQGIKAKRLKNGKWRVMGKITIRGVSKPLTVDLSVRKIPAKIAHKARLGRGNWIRVRGKFTVRLSEHGVKIPTWLTSKVSDRWIVKVSLFAKEK